MASIEEKVEEFFKKKLDSYNIRHYGKTESINPSIAKALKESESKSGNNGNNYPDLKLLIENLHSRRLPVMIEAKGSKNKLIKLSSDKQIVQVTAFPSDSKEGAKNPHKKGDLNYSAIQNYAVNGALHYGYAILNEGTYDEVLIIGINGSKLDDNGDVIDFEAKAYYVSKKNNMVPKEINNFCIKMLSDADLLFNIVDKLSLSNKELKQILLNKEIELESGIKKIHQSIYNNEVLKTSLSTNEKMFLFFGLIVAGLNAPSSSALDLVELKCNNSEDNNDGLVIMRYVTSFLKSNKCTDEMVEIVTNTLKPVFNKTILWTPNNGESLLKTLYKNVRELIIPMFDSNLRIDFAGKMMNCLNDWVSIDNDKKNDVVFTRPETVMLMTKITKIDKDSYVWDRAMGSGAFLIAAIDEMIKDAKKSCTLEELDEKIMHIKKEQVFGIEILSSIYLLSVLNMVLMGNYNAQIVCGNGHDMSLGSNFKANRFMTNPPYSDCGKGLNFLDEALEQMESGYASIIIQENAGSGQAQEIAKHILKKNTLLASIHMPNDIFSGKASVQAAIYVFEIGIPHNENNLVKFIDMSFDGYLRQNRKKSTTAINLKDVDNAKGRYEEVIARVLGRKPETEYYTKENGLYMEDTISLEGNDWTFAQHKKVDVTVKPEDLKNEIKKYLEWKLDFSKAV